MSTFTDKVAELDDRYAVAETISNDQFGNKRIAALHSQKLETDRQVITIHWKIHTTDTDGAPIEMRGLSNPYDYHQVAHTGIMIDPNTGEKVREQNQGESDEDYKANVLDSATSEYEMLVSQVKDDQARFFALIRANLQEADTENRI